MAHFAELDENNVVKRVIVIANDECKDENGNEIEAIGADFCHNLLGGRWIQTSYNGKIRKKYAGVGYFYNQFHDVFIEPQPFPSWTLDKSHEWQPPFPKPQDGKFYYWDESLAAWIEHT